MKGNNASFKKAPGYRNPGTGNWRFFFQLIRLARDASLAGQANATVAFQPVKHGDLMCVVCKQAAGDCRCPK